MMGSQTRRERSRGTASGARVTSRKTGKIMSDHRCVPCLWQPPGASRRPTAPRPLRRGLVAAAVMLAIGCAPPAWTQSITGGLHGTAPAASGITVEVTRPSTGYANTVTVQQGRYNLDYLAPGSYRVRVLQGGQVLGDYVVRVQPNTSATVPAVGAAGTPALPGNVTTLQDVNVSSAAMATVTTPIDVSTPELSSVYNASLMHDLPVSQGSIYAIANINSSVNASVRGSAYPQVGGASPTENRYYYNEFDTSYDITGAGAIVFPLEAVESTQVITGNGGVQWTSTTGALTSATLRQGTNDFHAGYTLHFTLPTSDLLSPKSKDSFNDAGKHMLYQSDNRYGGSANQYLWASGALVKDKLFFFAMLGNQPPAESSTYSATERSDNSSRNKNILLNVAWNISNDQSLNVAGYKTRTRSSYNAYAMDTPYEPSSAHGAPAWSGLDSRQKLLIGNYHWRISDNLSMRLMAGTMRFDYVGSSENSDKPYVSFYDGTTGVTTQLYGGSGDLYEQYNYYYAKRGFKGDFVWTLGDHELTFGGEKYKNIYHFQPATNPNGNWSYDYEPDYPGYYYGNGVYVPADGKMVYTVDYATGGTFDSVQKGYYVQDAWQATQNLNVTGGLRLDQMSNMAADGKSFLGMNVVSPRLGLAWDVNGDSSLKVGANIGRYTLPMPSNLNYLIATPYTYSYTYYSYTGMDPVTHVPTGTTKLGETWDYSTPQPSLVTLTSRNIENTRQNEFQAYVQKQLTPSWSLLAEVKANKLANIIDQTCDYDGSLTSYVRQNGHADYAGLGHCIEFNPGHSIVLRDDLDGTGALSEITIPNSYLRMPKARRTYYGTTFTLSHARTQEEPYFLSASYTWGHLYGNNDGYTNLTQTTTPQPGTSGNYVFQQFTDGFGGNLAADIRNNLVLSGVYYWNSGLNLGGVFNAHSGAPFSCLGMYPDPGNVPISGYRTTHYCGGKLSPLGSTWRSPTFMQLDLSLGYDLSLGSAGDLSMSLQVRNITNRQAVTSRYMTADLGSFDASGAPTPDPYFMAVNRYQAPRSTYFYLRYTF